LADPFTSARPATVQRPPSQREILWNELEELHAQLQLAPPTETHTIEQLEEVVARLRAQLEGPAV
jgi:hypothetical protein